MTERDLTDDEIERMIAERRQPAIAMVSTAYSGQTYTPGCWYGGRPTLPPDIEWPVCEIPELNISMPLQFVLQLNLDYVPHILGKPPLPRTGTLFLFFDSVLSPMPEIYIDSGHTYLPMLNGQAARIIYVDYDASDCPLRAPPPMPDFSNLSFEYRHLVEVEAGQKYEFDQKLFNFTILDTYSAAWSSSVIGTGKKDPFHSAWRKMDRINDSLRQELADWRFEDEDVIEIDDDPTFIDTIYGAWGVPGFPDAEYFEKLNSSSPRPLEKEDILLFRLESLQRRGPMTFWLKPENLFDQSFSDVFVWEEQP